MCLCIAFNPHRECERLNYLSSPNDNSPLRPNAAAKTFPTKKSSFSPSAQRARAWARPAGQFILVLLLLTIMYTLTNHLLLMTLFKRRRRKRNLLPALLFMWSSDHDALLLVCVLRQENSKQIQNKNTKKRTWRKSSSAALVEDVNDALNDNLKGCTSTRKVFQFVFCHLSFREEKQTRNDCTWFGWRYCAHDDDKKVFSMRCHTMWSRSQESAFWKINSFYFIIWESGCGKRCKSKSRGGEER